MKRFEFLVEYPNPYIKYLKIFSNLSNYVTFYYVAKLYKHYLLKGPKLM